MISADAVRAVMRDVGDPNRRPVSAGKADVVGAFRVIALLEPGSVEGLEDCENPVLNAA
ncbi:hypothetical protein [Streptomyces beijiangensis]|uniref:Uncharacterized protein n=1 Tax=Streptomyces beijiangensis TaxID=163361 RepID=A0A939JIB9_9ACTN|nr:hypothetical protein [Streptomyces beijiangensis]MBO0512404.1 hypothetical protein [Streptomyces beijiangensis]